MFGSGGRIVGLDRAAPLRMLGACKTAKGSEGNPLISQQVYSYSTKSVAASPTIEELRLVLHHKGSSVHSLWGFYGGKLRS